ncbi:uncharacterized protein LOC143303228 [Bombus vancouverensis nearcticus]|uniref:uncharacterized protein LOC143303228 n=1 Tax=Bombus vancouverensis nearcticus TaxID=2705178 RepID=UPI00402B9EE4
MQTVENVWLQWEKRRKMDDTSFPLQGINKLLPLGLSHNFIIRHSLTNGFKLWKIGTCIDRWNPDVQDVVSNQSQSAISQAVKSVCGCSRLRPCRAECNGMRVGGERISATYKGRRCRSNSGEHSCNNVIDSRIHRRGGADRCSTSYTIGKLESWNSNACNDTARRCHAITHRSLMSR